MKYKDTCNSKANEIKKLQTQLAYYRKRAMKSTAEVPQEDEHADLPNVI